MEANHTGNTWTYFEIKWSKVKVNRPINTQVRGNFLKISMLYVYSDQESSCDFISFDQAVSILRAELNYPEERALHFVKRFDHNKDGKLSVAEFRQFKGKIEETWADFFLSLISSHLPVL